MSQVPDLVKETELETSFGSGGHIVHIYTETGPSAQEQVVRRRERWIPKECIGRGAYGSVSLQECIEWHHGPKVRAVKKIVKSSQASERKLYTRELVAISKFSIEKYERRFVKSFGWYESKNAVYITMEYLEHGDLAHYLRSNPTLSEFDTKQIIWQVLEGLKLMHDNGFSHRDIKPGNILIKSKPPDPWWIKLGDFGISKRAVDGAPTSLSMRGTLDYLAPEAFGFIGSRGLSQRNTKTADIWATGATTFQILTKRALFETPDAMLKYVNAPKTFPLDVLVKHNLSDACIDFIRCLVQPYPRDRCSAEKAMDHRWLVDLNTHGATDHKHLSMISEPSSQATDHTSLTIDTVPPPSGRWSTVSAAKVTSASSPTNEMSAMVEEQSNSGRPSIISETAQNRAPAPQAPVQHAPPTPTARFFVLKSFNEINIETSAAFGIWSCNAQTNTRLSKAYGSTRGPVFLIYSVNKSRQFCGVAQMMTPWSPHVPDEHWENGDWEGGFHVKWLSWTPIHFDEVKHLKNKGDEGVSIIKGHYTLELCMRTGREMMRRFGVSERIDWRAPRRALEPIPQPRQPRPQPQTTSGSIPTKQPDPPPQPRHTTTNTPAYRTVSSPAAPPRRRMSANSTSARPDGIKPSNDTHAHGQGQGQQQGRNRPITKPSPRKRSFDQALGHPRVAQPPRKQIKPATNQFSFVALMAELQERDDQSKVS